MNFEPNLLYVITSKWCKVCPELKLSLNSLYVNYKEIDVETIGTNGRLSIPQLLWNGNTIMTGYRSDKAHLKSILRSNGIIK